MKSIQRVEKLVSFIDGVDGTIVSVGVVVIGVVIIGSVTITGCVVELSVYVKSHLLTTKNLVRRYPKILFSLSLSWYLPDLSCVRYRPP